LPLEAVYAIVPYAKLADAPLGKRLMIPVTTSVVPSLVTARKRPPSSPLADPL
jgi:hypothetical protein